MEQLKGTNSRGRLGKAQIPFLSRILATSETIAGLPTAALVSATSGSFVLALMTGGIFWVPFAMLAGACGHRFYQLHDSRHLRRLRKQIDYLKELQEMEELLDPATGEATPEAKKQEEQLENLRKIINDDVKLSLGEDQPTNQKPTEQRQKTRDAL